MADEHRIARLLLGLRPGDGVLDVACGPGNFTRDFARVARPRGLVVGIDASETMLARAVRDTPADQAERRPTSAATPRAPFRDASFDARLLLRRPAPLRRPDDGPGPHGARADARRPPGDLHELPRALGARCAARRRSRAPAAGMRIFEPDEITTALADRGFVDVRQRVAGFTQFVGARLPRA